MCYRRWLCDVLEEQLQALLSPFLPCVLSRLVHVDWIDNAMDLGMRAYLCMLYVCIMYIGVIKKLTQVQNLQSTDIVIANLGIHYNFEEPSQLRKYENEVSLFVNELKEKTPTPKLLWMESSPQHFPGAENGYYEEQNNKKNMIVVNRKPGSENNASSSWCQPFGNYSLAHSEDHRNRLVERLRTGLPVIPLWQYLWNLSYAHLEQPKRKDSIYYGK